MIVALLLCIAAPYDVTWEEYWIARVIEGEGYDEMPGGEPAAWYIADTVYNRLEAGWCNNVEHCIRSAYWGHIRAPIPTSQSITLAKEIVAHKRERDRADIFYAFGHGDVEYLGLKAQDAVVSVTIEGYGFYFYGRGISLDAKANRSSTSGTPGASE